ncbi:MAG: hypothetical protein ACOCWG_02475 [bacterium]
MKKRFILALIGGLIFATSCQYQEISESGDTSSYQECKLKNITIEDEQNKGVIHLKYSGDTLKVIDIINPGGDNQQSIFYYNEKGKLDQIIYNDTLLKEEFVYDKEKLTAIKGTGKIITREFEYDKNQRIIEQRNYFGDDLFSTMKFTYDELNNPSESKVFDKTGNPIVTLYFDYDDKINPYQFTGFFANTAEMMFGYPVGNDDNNLVGIYTKYDKNIGVIDGQKEKGTIDTAKIYRSYNEYGYPTEVRSKDVHVIHGYDCIDKD